MTEHPRHRLIDALSATDNADFATLRDQLGVSDSVLSRQISQLEELGIVAVKKGYVGKRPRTWLSLTDDGRRQWAAHLDALRAIAGSY